MSHRTLLYQALRGSTDLAEIVDDRILQASSLVEGAIPEKPFVTYRMHTDFPRPVGGKVGRREYCQVWANDVPGDYLQIDKILDICRQAVEAIPSSKANGAFLEARWIETGVDLRDQDMGTINRYIRFQFTSTLRELT
jgi:hypothetical protein